jgi:hypothetical protein
VLDNPPLNLMGPEFVLQIRDIVTELESDDQVKVALLERGLQTPGDVQQRLGLYLGQ